MKITYRILCFLIVSISVNPTRTHASLGDNLASVTKDHKALHATSRTSTTQSAYSVEEITTDASTIREYLSPAGVVFGIAWGGLSHPDLSSLLGSYKNEYQQALQNDTSPRGRRHSQIKSDRVVVEKWGHMRNMKGRAYIPALIPAGVTAYEIQ
jgi:hypothetical protein